MCMRCRKVYKDGIDLLQGCPACGWKKFQFIKAGRRVDVASWEMKAEDIAGKPVITSAMGVRRPPKVKVALELEKDSVEGRFHGRTGQVYSSQASDRAMDGYRERAGQGNPGQASDRAMDGYRERAGQGNPGQASDRDLDEESAKIEEKKDGVELESIRIEEPGSYELNLDTLFNRDELVMSFKEGTYIIDLSTAFRKPRKE